MEVQLNANSFHVEGRHTHTSDVDSDTFLEHGCHALPHDHCDIKASLTLWCIQPSQAIETRNGQNKLSNQIFAVE